jgi:hypothetical protein
MNFENATQKLVDGDDRAVTHNPRSPVRSVEILRCGGGARRSRQGWARALSKLPQADVARHLGITRQDVAHRIKASRRR